VVGAVITLTRAAETAERRTFVGNAAWSPTGGRDVHDFLLNLDHVAKRFAAPWRKTLVQE
jgi:hypothetical protein